MYLRFSAYVRACFMKCVPRNMQLMCGYVAYLRNLSVVHVVCDGLRFVQPPHFSYFNPHDSRSCWNPLHKSGFNFIHFVRPALTIYCNMHTTLNTFVVDYRSLNRRFIIFIIIILFSHDRAVLHSFHIKVLSNKTCVLIWAVRFVYHKSNALKRSQIFLVWSRLLPPGTSGICEC